MSQQPLHQFLRLPEVGVVFPTFAWLKFSENSPVRAQCIDHSTWVPLSKNEKSCEVWCLPCEVVIVAYDLLVLYIIVREMWKCDVMGYWSNFRVSPPINRQSLLKPELYGNRDCGFDKHVMPALLTGRNIFRLLGPRTHLDAHQQRKGLRRGWN